MNKQPDFGTELANLQDSVTAEVGDVLHALQQKRSATRIATIKQVEPPAASSQPNGNQPSASPVDAPMASTSTATPRRQRSASRSRLVTAFERDEPLENVTTRLRQRTNELLTEAALRQRLKKETPATRQDIVEAALSDWFRRHGYLRGRDEESDD